MFIKTQLQLRNTKLFSKKQLLQFQVLFTNVILKEDILIYCCLTRLQLGFHHFYVAK